MKKTTIKIIKEFTQIKESTKGFIEIEFENNEITAIEDIAKTKIFITSELIRNLFKIVKACYSSKVIIFITQGEKSSIYYLAITQI